MLEEKDVYRNKLEFRQAFKRYMRERSHDGEAPEGEKFRPFVQERDHLGRMLDTEKARMLPSEEASTRAQSILRSNGVSNEVFGK